MFDYRGYGGSTGTATLDAILGDGLSIYDRVRDAIDCWKADCRAWPIIGQLCLG